MQYRKLKGDKLFDGRQLLEGQVLVVHQNGTVQAIVNDTEAGEGVEKWDGILVPGFINCHCHLELSYLKGRIPPHTGLVPFLISVVKLRGIEYENKQAAIAAAEKEMFDSGITGVADICNTTDAITVKKESSMRWHSLIEVLNFYDSNLQQQLTVYQNVLQEHVQNNLPAVLTPHAPYTVSKATYTAINEATAGKIISMHNQETATEDELFQKGTGEFLKLYQEFGDGRAPFPVSGRSSLQTWLPGFTNGQTILLVHNTFIKEADIVFAKEQAGTFGLNLVYCVCPNANLYIENRLPPIDLLLKHNCRVVLGTDSYSSNGQLSIGSEIETMQKHFPHLSLETLLQWATSDAAKVMQWNDLGSFEKGKKPGVVCINEQASGGLAVKRII